MTHLLGDGMELPSKALERVSKDADLVRRPVICIHSATV